MDREKQNKVLEMKGMVLEHVLYEMRMYLYTLLELNSKYPRDQLKTNMIMVSHETHLRNLLEFFAKKQQTNIVYSDLLDLTGKDHILTELNIDDKNFCFDWTVKKVINKSISHLTEERATMNITAPTICAIKEMEKVIPNIIKMFIGYLETDLKKEWKIRKKDVVIRLVEERDSEHIQLIIKSIKEMLHSLDSK